MDCVPLEMITFFLLIFGILFYASRRKTAHEQAWRKFTSQNVLLFERVIFSKNPRVRGIYCGYDLLLDTYSTITGFQAGSHSFTRPSFQNTLTNQNNDYPVISDNRLYALRFYSSVIPTADAYLNRRFAISGQPKKLAMDIFSDEPLRLYITPSTGYDENSNLKYNLDIRIASTAS